MITSTDPAGPDDLTQLRRRLYQPSASERDVDRYRAAVAAMAPPPPVVSAVRPRRDGRKLAALVAIPAAVTAIALLLGAIAATSRPMSAPTSKPDQMSTTGLTANRPTSAPYSFQQAAESTQPLSLSTTDTDAGVSFTGIGPGTIPLDGSDLSAHGGIIRVDMLSDTSDAVGWQMNRIATRADFSSYDQTLARGRAGQEMAPVSAVDVEYKGDPPMTILVSAPVGTRWWLDLRLAPRSR